MKSRELLTYITFFCLYIMLQACTSLKEDYNKVDYPNPIKIGFLVPFSEDRLAAEDEYLGVYLAAEEINDAGGILGRKIQIVARNDGGSAEIGVEASKKLYDEGIRIIIGPDWSSVTLAVAKEVTIPKEMILMSYSSTNPDISHLDDKDLVWRTCPSDVFQGKVGAAYCKKHLKKQTAAILALNNPYSLELAKTFKENFINLGGTITHFGIYPELLGDEATKYDYTKHLDSLFATHPDVFYLASYPEDGAKITNDIAKNNYLTAGYNPVFFSNDGIASNYFLLNGFPSIVNKFIGTRPGASKTQTNYLNYFDQYQSKWGFEPVIFSEFAYDAMYLIAYSILSNDGKPEPFQIASYFRKISGSGGSPTSTKINVNEFGKARDIILAGGQIDYDGASGKIEFDINGDPGCGSYIIWKVDNKAFFTDTIINFP